MQMSIDLIRAALMQAENQEALAALYRLEKRYVALKAANQAYGEALNRPVVININQAAEAPNE